jgi:hypothetical protein
MPPHDQAIQREQARIKEALWHALQALGTVTIEASAQALLEFWVEATVENLEEFTRRHPTADVELIVDRLLVVMAHELRRGMSGIARQRTRHHERPSDH